MDPFTGRRCTWSQGRANTRSRARLVDVWRGSERAPGVQRRRNGLIVRPNVDRHCYGTRVVFARHFAMMPILRRRGGRNELCAGHRDRHRILVRLRSPFLRPQFFLPQLFLVQSQILVGCRGVSKGSAQAFAFCLPAIAQAAGGLIPELLGVLGHPPYPRRPAPLKGAHIPRSTLRKRSGLRSTAGARMPCRRFLREAALRAATRRSSHHPPSQKSSRCADRDERPESVELKCFHAARPCGCIA
jgi:hypothetical protein